MYLCKIYLLGDENHERNFIIPISYDLKQGAHFPSHFEHVLQLMDVKIDGL
jgi:hypothetical protein